jgi:hypothetical protein
MLLKTRLASWKLSYCSAPHFVGSKDWCPLLSVLVESAEYFYTKNSAVRRREAIALFQDTSDSFPKRLSGKSYLKCSNFLCAVGWTGGDRLCPGRMYHSLLVISYDFGACMLAVAFC